MEALVLPCATKKSILLNIVLYRVPSSSPAPPVSPYRPSLLSGGVQDEEDRCHQMGEAGGRGTGVQHQTLQSQSVQSFCIYTLFTQPSSCLCPHLSICPFLPYPLILRPGAWAASLPPRPPVPPLPSPSLPLPPPLLSPPPPLSLSLSHSLQRSI